jgi:hypothetical protein
MVPSGAANSVTKNNDANKILVTLGCTQTMNTMQQPTKNSRERWRIYSRGDLMREGTTGEGPCNGFGGY